MNQTRCIYCDAPFQPGKGEGDHVLPDRFGRFKGAMFFRGICPSCNSKLSPGEEQLTRCGPEALMLRIIDPKNSRRGSERRWIGAGGLPPPQFTIPHEDHGEQVQLGDQPDVVKLSDHLIVKTQSNQEIRIPLSEKISAEAIRRRIESVTKDPVKAGYLHCDDKGWGFYEKLLLDVWPNWCLSEREGREIGVHRVPVRIRFTFNGDYWRAIAKIAFHYYLVTNRSGFTGREKHFEPIRRYLMGVESNHKAVFERVPPRFQTPGGDLGDGRAMLPTTWHHSLAYNDHNGEVVAGVQLCMGPQNAASMHTVFLGSYRSRIIVPGSISAHVYEHVSSAGPNYDGQVRSTTPIRIG